MPIHCLNGKSAKARANEHARHGSAGVLLSKMGVLPLGKAPMPGVFLLRVLPSVVSFAGTLYLGNYAYLSLSMAFIQMLKAMVPAITLVHLFRIFSILPSILI